MKRHDLPRLPDWVPVVLGLLVLLAGGVMAALGFGGHFSEWERRYLADPPGAPDLNDWKTDRQTETWLTDHVPMRQALVAVDSGLQLAAGRGSELNAWYVFGAVVEKPVEADDAALDTLDRKLNRLGRLADKASVPWVILTPETHGSLLRSRMNPLTAAAYADEEAAMARIEATGHRAAMPAAFATSPDTMYYRTDHHWTLQGAWQAYAALGDALGYTPLPLNRFRASEFPGFRGTTLSRSGLPPLLEDTLVCAEPDSPVTLTTQDYDAEARENVTAVYDRLIFPEEAATYDGYAVYLKGNHGLLTIERPDAPEGTLIVYKDSFANCLLPLLSQHYRRVIAVDARYFTGRFSDALALSDDTAAILYLYSLDSLVNDTEITKKAR